MIEAEAIENGKLRVYMQKFLFLQAKQGGALAILLWRNISQTNSPSATNATE